MKIVDLQTFCALPVGTIYSEVHQGRSEVEELCRRGRVGKINEGSHFDSIRDHFGGDYNDFYYHSLLPMQTQDSLGPDWNDKTRFEDIDNGMRWGCQDPDAIFLVYEKYDIAKMIGYLSGETTTDGEADGKTEF
jgi:hypothetical protein